MCLSDLKKTKDPKEKAITGKETFTKKIAGIKAWRNSPANRLYIQLGRQGILDNKSLTDLMAEDNTNLTSAEFDAIVGLNQKLIRYS